MIDIENLSNYLPVFHGGLEGLGILILRVIWGIALVFYSIPMLKNPWHWMDMGKPSGMPAPLQGLGALTIFGGGIAMISGLLTFLAALALSGAMGIALSLNLAKGVPFMKERPDAPGQSYEASLVYLAIALMFVFVGPGMFSLDFLLFGR
jgi:putative oxidoreductase